MNKIISFLKILSLIFILEANNFADSLFIASDPITGSMFSDRRARSIGDIITIIVSESSTSTQSGKTALSNKSSLASEIKNLLYPAASAVTTSTSSLYSGMDYLGSKVGGHRGTMPKSEWDSKKDFEGDGELASSNNVSGSITAMIIEVLPNGNFIVEGKRMVTVDDESRNIKIAGIVRPEDIGADNSIESKYLANAKITFEGDGPISKYRQRSLLQKVWDFIRLY